MSGERVAPSNAISLSAAIIGIISGIAAGKVGYDHAVSAWEAATGSSAGVEDYIDVARAFWDALPIAATVAIVAGLLAAGHVVNAAFLRYGAGGVGLLALAIGSQADPKHLEVYNQTVNSGQSGTLGLLQLWFGAYGLLAGLLAVIAGVGVGYAAGTERAKA